MLRGFEGTQEPVPSQCWQRKPMEKRGGQYYPIASHSVFKYGTSAASFFGHDHPE